jgi:hypothetical protein
MSLLSRVKTWVSGDVLTAADLNAEFDNTITGLDPVYIEDESDTKTIMRTQSDPFPTATPSLPTTLQGEIYRIRYQLANILGETYWYMDPDMSIAALAAHGTRHKSGGADSIQIDDFVAASDNTDLNVTTSAHGLAPKAIAPATGFIHFLGIGKGQTTFYNKELYNATDPSNLNFSSVASPGESLYAARRDHVHGMMSLPAATDGITTIKIQNSAVLGTSSYFARKDHKHAVVATLDICAAPTDNTHLDVSISKHGLCPKGDNSALHALLGNLTWGHPDAHTWEGAHKFVSSTLPSTSQGATDDIWFQYDA